MPILSKSEFAEKLKTLNSQKWSGIEFDEIYADYYKSGKSFEEWIQEPVLN